MLCEISIRGVTPWLAAVNDIYLPLRNNPGWSTFILVESPGSVSVPGTVTLGFGAWRNILSFRLPTSPY